MEDVELVLFAQGVDAIVAPSSRPSQWYAFSGRYRNIRGGHGHTVEEAVRKLQENVFNNRRL